MLAHLQLSVTGRGRRRGGANFGLFRVADATLGMARLPLLAADHPGSDASMEPVVAEGVFLFSQLHAGSSPERVERRRATMRAYQIRARTRPTPQGVFAGAAELKITETESVLALGAKHEARSYPNPIWLNVVCDSALDSTAVLRALRFTCNNLAVRRGDRLEVERPATDALAGPQRVSIRATEAVETIMEVCRFGAAWGQIAAAIAQAWPAVPEAAVDAALRCLTRGGFMLTDLAPPDARDDPLGHILRKLPEAEPLSQDLSRLRAALVEADRHTPGEAARMTALKAARQVSDSLAATWRPLAVDVACDARIRVPNGLAERVARVADVLWRLAPAGDHMTDWHERFLGRYGTHRLVPLLEACDPVTGLGCDVGGLDRPPRPQVEEAMIGLLADALASGELEVRLDAQTIDALDRRETGDRPEPSAELYVRILVAGTRERDAGRYVLAVTGMAAPAGSTRARFNGLIPTGPGDADAGQGTMTAELVFQPRALAAAALTGNADLALWRIPIGATPRAGDLMPQDLAVLSDGRRLTVWSTLHHRPVKPVHHNQVGHHLMPPLAGFLCRLGQHGTVPLSPWRWESLENAPFRPRVRCGDAILSAARWKLPTCLRRAAGDPMLWATALRRWRTGTRPAPPATVVTDDADRQLPLDLDRDDDRELLRRYVGRGVRAVTEPPGGPDAAQAVVPGPTGHHALELVVPLAATTQPEVPVPPAPTRIRDPGQCLFLPGGPWLSLAVRAPQSTQDAILKRIRQAARQKAGLWDRWFWIRYATAEHGPHLRIRFHGDATVLGGALLPVMNEVCAELIPQRLSGGFSVEPYEQEIERYGGPGTIEAAETVFFRDSELVLALLCAEPDPDQRLVLTAVSAAAIARTLAHSDTAALAPYQLGRADRRTYARLRRYARHLDESDPCEPDLWHARQRALQEFHNLLPRDRHADCASSLIHMHANRMLGDHTAERIARAVAADLLARKPYE